MMKVLSDDVGEHDLLHPCCRPEMYDFFYQNGGGHPSCFDNINKALEERRAIITPVNLFMHTKINSDGSILVEEPLSKAGDKIILKALDEYYIGSCRLQCFQKANAIAESVPLLKLLSIRTVSRNIRN